MIICVALITQLRVARIHKLQGFHTDRSDMIVADYSIMVESMKVLLSVDNIPRSYLWMLETFYSDYE